METFDYKFDNGKKVHLPPPTVEAYYKIYHAISDSEKVEGLCEWLAGGSPEARAYIQPIDMAKAELALSAWLRDLRQRPEYKAPYYKSEEQTETHYSTVYHELKVVSDYTHDSFTELKKIDVLTFWRYYRDAIIYNCSKSEIGMEYLKNAYNQEQTKPDRAAIAAIMNMQQ